ncbi:MAG TPA: hypothetical protein VKT78_07905 [Fimbriimonadaceae bacterium]|nr:hypothetical protein [Fimbriimonadaceae bacterium]
MKVRCIQLIDGMGNKVTSSPWVRLGDVYHVLAIWIDPKQTRFRLVGGREASPVLYDPEMFELVSTVIPPSWIVTSLQAGCFALEPEPWTQRGFWEEFFDGEPNAVACFERERQKIIDSDP